MFPKQVYNLGDPEPARTVPRRVRLFVCLVLFFFLLFCGARVLLRRRGYRENAFPPRAFPQFSDRVRVARTRLFFRRSDPYQFAVFRAVIGFGIVVLR